LAFDEIAKKHSIVISS